MTDIVERLEEEVRIKQQASLGNGCAACGVASNLLTEAKDEIERLRDALRSVIEAWNNEYAGEMAIDRAILVERLEEASREARELLHGPLSEALKKTQ